MNRPLKFRAWDKTRQLMMTDEFMNLALFASLDVTLNHVSDLAVMQWTGLTDKNGKDIYEGDILGYITSLKNRDQETKAVVEYCTNNPNAPDRPYRFAAFHLHLIQNACEMWDVDEYGGDEEDEWWDEPWEVIGNIYENPLPPKPGE